ncbi:hypothetical protein NIES19_06470 [Anabaena cylindrica PCC 7122]|nr:hypothetical protein NIES19_06470 [Anabaena cylindrica PCC 7122]
MLPLNSEWWHLFSFVGANCIRPYLSVISLLTDINLSFSPYGRGWKSKSGKKRLNSIKIPAVIVSQMVAATGAVEMNLIK